MSARVTALLCATMAIAFGIAQLLVPGHATYHEWWFITAIALAIGYLLWYGHLARIGRDGPRARRLSLAMAGAIVAGAAALVSALIGPDDATVTGAPGAVTPVADLKAAVFFPTVDARTIALGDSGVVLRTQQGRAIAVDARPVWDDLAVLFVRQQPAGFVAARDLRGNHLTVTQPNNVTFLSPVLTFRSTQDIRGRALPFDRFALPALHRNIAALYFSATELASVGHGAKGDGPSTVLSMSDEQGTARGLAIAPSGHETVLDTARITVTLGTYPVLVIASAPQPLAFGLGIIVFLAGLVWFALPAPTVSTTDEERRPVPA